MKFSNFVECFIFTCLGSYPFLAVVNYKPDPTKDFRSCNEPCYFIRNFGTKALPATTPANLKVECGKFRCSKNFFWSPVPIFVAVENGRGFSDSVPSVPSEWQEFMTNAFAKVIQLYSSMISRWQEESDWPSPANVNQTVCETEKVRKKIENHLNTGYTIPIYKVGIFGWTALKILHDFALLADVPEKATLLLGICSWIFQLVATCAAFSWGGAAAEVFIARVSTETNDACFYQLKTMEAFTALGTPLLLLSLTHFKLQNLMLSVVNGDFLYYKAYDVPYRVVKATAAESPLLIFGLRGDPGFPAAPYQQLTFRNMNALYQITKTMYLLYMLTVLFLICPFGFGNIFLRMTEVAVSHDFSWDPNGMIKLATLAAAGALLIYPALILFRILFSSEVRKAGERPTWAVAVRWIVAILAFFVFASTSVVAWEVIQAVRRQEGTAGVEQRYEWYLCGATGGYFGFGLLSGRSISVALKVMGSYTFNEEQAHKSTQRVERFLVGTQNEGEITSRQVLLDGSDRYTSHVEQALEVFRSQPEKVKHLLPCDTEESYAQSHAQSYAQLRASDLAAQMESQPAGK